jgi:HEAT repeat protein
MGDLTEFVAKLESSDETERIYAAEDIGYLNASEGVAPLLARLDQEPSRAVRDAIFQALTRIDADASMEGCIRLLESDDPQIRNQAVDILRRKGDAAIPMLSTVMREGDKDLRKLVLDVLSEAHTACTDAIYEAALSDPDPNVVITAVENLGRAHAHRFKGRVEELLLAGSHPMLIGACLEALVGIGDASSLATLRRRFPELATLPDFVLVSCLKAIGAIGTEREFAEIAGLLAGRGQQLRPAILAALIAIHQRHAGKAHDEDVLPLLRNVIDDLNAPLCCYQAVRALGFVSSRDDVYAFLIGCLTSPERMVRLGAIESLRETCRRPELEEVLAERALAETDADILQALRS